jgi:hypothetical protein
LGFFLLCCLGIAFVVVGTEEDPKPFESVMVLGDCISGDSVADQNQGFYVRGSGSRSTNKTWLEPRYLRGQNLKAPVVIRKPVSNF